MFGKAWAGKTKSVFTPLHTVSFFIFSNIIHFSDQNIIKTTKLMEKLNKTEMFAISREDQTTGVTALLVSFETESQKKKIYGSLFVLT